MQLQAQRDSIIAALYANSNFSGEEGGQERAESIKSLEQHFNKAITTVYYPNAFKEPDIDWSNPFYAAAKRSLQRTREAMQGLAGNKDETMQEAVDTEMSKDQAEARERGRQAIDQI